LEAERPSYSMCRVAFHASGVGERDDRLHTWRASVFLPAQATHHVGD